MPDPYTSKANELISDLVSPENSSSSPNNFDRVSRSDDAYRSRVLGCASHPDMLHNATAPSIAIQKETPEHRQMILLKAMGMSNNAIAQHFGKTPAWVSQILNQPWAKVRLVEEISKAGRDPLKTMIESAALDSVTTLIELRDNPATPPAVRHNSANSLLDRYLGKPTQHIESKSEVRNVPGEIQEVERQLKELEAEEKRLGINVIPSQN